MRLVFNSTGIATASFNDLKNDGNVPKRNAGNPSGYVSLFEVHARSRDGAWNAKQHRLDLAHSDQHEECLEGGTSFRTSDSGP